MAFLAESGDDKFFFLSHYIGSNRRLKEWVYITPDDVEAVTGASYFDFDSAATVHPGDLIRVIQASDRTDLSTMVDEYRLFVVGRSGTVLDVELRPGVSIQTLGGSAFMQDFLVAADLAAAQALLDLPEAQDLSAYAPLASPTFTGTPAAPTATPGTETTQISTTGFVKAAVDAAVTAIRDGVASGLDTLAEIATDLGLKMVKTANLSDVASAATAFANIKQDATESATGVLEIGTAAEFRSKAAGTLALTTQIWDAAAEVTLTDAATIVVDMSTFINATVTLGGNRTLGSPTNEKVGQGGFIRIVQDGTGSRTLAYGTDWEFAGGTAPVLTTTASAQDVLFYYVIASNRVLGNLVKAIA